MAVEIIYDVGEMKTYSNNNANKIVRSVELTVIGINGDKKDKQVKTVLLSEPSSYSNFTEYNNLTKEQLITWAKNSIATDELTAWENGITEYLNMPIYTGNFDNPIIEDVQPSSWNN